LFLNFLDRPTLELFPEAENKFFVKPIDVLFSFVKDEKGQVTHFLQHLANGRNILAKKIK